MVSKSGAISTYHLFLEKCTQWKVNGFHISLKKSVKYKYNIHCNNIISKYKQANNHKAEVDTGSY